MKIIIPLILVLCAVIAKGEEVMLGDTGDFYSRERYVWSVPSERIAKLPVWRKGTPVPLSVPQAEKIASEWWPGHLTLIGHLPERPLAIALVTFPAPYQDRHFYKVHLATRDGRDSLWTIHVLMDGSVVPPVEKKPNKAPEPTP